eukprot:jgi/Botrbrau1/1083/Bobra.0076s0047.1
MAVGTLKTRWSRKEGYLASSDIIFGCNLPSFRPSEVSCTILHLLSGRHPTRGFPISLFKSFPFPPQNCSMMGSISLFQPFPFLPQFAPRGFLSPLSSPFSSRHKLLRRWIHEVEGRGGG